jgi:hypothetical protein
MAKADKLLSSLAGSKPAHKEAEARKLAATGHPSNEVRRP